MVELVNTGVRATVTLVAPSGMVAWAGTFTTAGLSDFRSTTRPPAGAGVDKVRVTRFEPTGAWKR